MNIECRYIPKTKSTVSLEKRADGKNTLVGYAAVFYNPNDEGTQYELYPSLVERVMPTAFDRALRENQDILALFNHSMDWVLGRTKSGTCKLSVDSIGLRYEVVVPDSQSVQERVVAPIMRGDVDGSSFSFSVPDGGVKFVYNSKGGGPDVRELHDINLHDVGPTPMPAYTSTSSSIRAIGDLAEVRCACERTRVEPRGVIRYNNAPLIDEDNWDAGAAQERVKSWASDGDQMNMAKYARAFTWHDGSSTADGHRMLHHDVRGGKLMVHRGAVQQCMRMLDDDGGGVPEEDRKACRSHLERHAGAWDDPEDGEENDSELEEGDEMDMMRKRLRLAEIS